MICESRTHSAHPQKGDPKSAANYWPIACLNKMYKAVTAYIASELLTYTYTNDLLPMAQQAMKKGWWGCVELWAYPLVLHGSIMRRHMTESLTSG